MYFGGPTNAIATADPDADGLTNLQEYQRGSNPLVSDRVSLGEAGAPEFAVNGRDEIARLAQSITRMRRSLEQAMKMLGA